MPGLRVLCVWVSEKSVMDSSTDSFQCLICLSVRLNVLHCSYFTICTNLHQNGDPALFRYNMADNKDLKASFGGGPQEQHVNSTPARNEILAARQQ